MDKSKTPAVFGSTDLPAHLQNSKGLGNEGVLSTHLEAPAIKQVQKANIDSFVDGTKVGDWVVLPENKNFGQSVYLVPVTFEEKWLIWPQKQGDKPPLATHYNEADASADIGNHEMGCRVTYTHDHLFLVMDPETGTLSEIPARFPMSSTKLKTSKSLNTQIMARPGDRFSAVWKLTSGTATNKDGQTYADVSTVEFQAYLNEPEYLIAKQVFQNITGARSAAA